MTTPLENGQGNMGLPTEPKDSSKSCEPMGAATSQLHWRLPQIEDLMQAVAAADRGDFASDAEAAAAFARYARPVATLPRR